MDYISERAAVSDFVRAHNAPRVTSLDDFTHIFHFSENDWRTSPILFVNRNGNHMRLIRDRDSKWCLFKTWNGLFDIKDWMATSGPRFTDAEKSIQLMTIGSGGRSETLCLLPRDVTPAGRRAVWRQHSLSIRFNQRSDTFSIFADANQMENGQPSNSPDFSGKSWESTPAANWCKTYLRGKVKVETPGVIVNPYERERKDAEIYASLEDNPLFGAFGAFG